jgi:hypothetical protein
MVRLGTFIHFPEVREYVNAKAITSIGGIGKNRSKIHLSCGTVVNVTQGAKDILMMVLDCHDPG